jgi:ABC-type transport system involved in cytochrome bd biosynthesis fused ATPase/permease subunit
MYTTARIVGVVIMVCGLDRFGQARIMEAIAATVIILVLAALMPMLFKSPTTQLQSQVESNLETYAQTVLAELINNPQFLVILEHGNWSAL